jgi:hypothetical protein
MINQTETPIAPSRYRSACRQACTVVLISVLWVPLLSSADDSAADLQETGRLLIIEYVPGVTDNAHTIHGDPHLFPVLIQ